MSIGIFIGESFTQAIYDDGSFHKDIPLDRQRTVIPTVVSQVDEEEFCFGWAAQRREMEYPKDTFRGFLPLFSRNFHPKNSLFSDHSSISYDDASGGVVRKTRFGSFHVDEIVFLYLQHVFFQISEIYDLENEDISLIIPSSAMPYVELWQQKIRNEFPNFQIRFIPFPIAMGFALQSGLEKPFEGKHGVLVLGEKNIEGFFLDLNPSGQNIHYLGHWEVHSDFGMARVDEFRFQEIKDQLYHDHEFSLADHPAAAQRVMDALRSLKNQVQTQKSVKVQIPYLGEMHGEPMDLNYDLQVSQVVESMSGALGKSCEKFSIALKCKGLSVADFTGFHCFSEFSETPYLIDIVKEKLGLSVQYHHPSDIKPTQGLHLESLPESDWTLRALPFSLGLEGIQGECLSLVPKMASLPFQTTIPIQWKESWEPKLRLWTGDSQKIIENSPLGNVVFSPFDGKMKFQQEESNSADLKRFFVTLHVNLNQDHGLVLGMEASPQQTLLGEFKMSGLRKHNGRTN